MIKTKTQYKEVTGFNVAGKLTVLALDGWQLASPVFYTPGQGSTGLVFRETKVEGDRESLFKMFDEDFKLEIGKIKCSGEKDRLAAFLNSNKATSFIERTAVRYGVKEDAVKRILIENLNMLTWYPEDDESPGDNG